MPTRPELERFFFLDDDDRDLIALRRTDLGAHVAEHPWREPAWGLLARARDAR